ncbi:transcriptional regulator [Aeromicrobium sp. PE09-221]|uniref:FMN-binding negative transcriptional regulator n=1 Tax=Aeromicrobium sp. PE09-221 TaxID=1898043 RepID=UPI000B3EE1C8|nr:FMN-binding negative transcriptional regulator [Aeromicrobium sp. PE09-221]OUZ10078.1 transcriptional regulator [Aeromicrobium sp. PE09-221]
MYRPPFTGVDDDAEIRSFVAEVAAGEVVTSGHDGFPRSTRLPLVWREDLLIAHFARANDHWREIADGSPVLVIVGGIEGYVSPSWYASKREHGRVVPTWNYESAQIRGRARVIEDPDWLRGAVTALTEAHERRRPDSWEVSDAPERFVEGQLRGIVGLEIRIEDVAAKAKLSQNRSAADRQGVVEGLDASDDPRDQILAERMRRV